MCAEKAFLLVLHSNPQKQLLNFRPSHLPWCWWWKPGGRILPLPPGGALAVVVPKAPSPGEAGSWHRVVSEPPRVRQLIRKQKNGKRK